MKQWRASQLAILLGLGLFFFAPHQTWAGDEDEASETKKVVEAPVEVAAPVAPPAPEAVPDPSAGVESPVVEEQVPQLRKKSPPRREYTPFDPDKNLDFSEVVGSIDTQPLDSGVAPPAQGFRGYRPNMIAVGYGDRTPGYGVMLEYSWNRLGVGAYYSYLPTTDLLVGGRIVRSQSFGGLYALYRWLPFDASPYFLVGAELASPTDETIGGTAGLGVEAKLYYGWTILLGYTYHSVVHGGYLGGAIGWSF